MKMRDDTASVKHVLNESKFSVEEGFGITPGNYTIDQFNAAIITSGILSIIQVKIGNVKNLLITY